MKVAKSLQLYGRTVQSRIENKIVETDTIDTGDLLRSIKYYQIGNYIQFSMLDYGKFTDEGTIRIKPRKFFNEVIDDSADLLEQMIFRDLELEIDRVFEASGRLG
jgi:hypothetical protein